MPHAARVLLMVTLSSPMPIRSAWLKDMYNFGAITILINLKVRHICQYGPRHGAGRSRSPPTGLSQAAWLSHENNGYWTSSSTGVTYADLDGRFSESLSTGWSDGTSRARGRWGRITCSSLILKLTPVRFRVPDKKYHCVECLVLFINASLHYSYQAYHSFIQLTDNLYFP